MERGAWQRAGGMLAALALALASGVSPARAQSQEQAEDQLQALKSELEQVAAERRQLDDQRGEASQALRAADQQVARSSKALRQTRKQLAASQADLAELEKRRDALQASLQDRRLELARLLRAADRQGAAAPLKLLLAQDRVADARRLLTYHRYLQADRAQRITGLTDELRQLDALERQIVARRAELDATLARQNQQLAQLTADRDQRAKLVAKLNARYQDKRSREQALVRDAQALEELLAKLRAEAARERARRAAAAAEAAREAREDGRPPPQAPVIRGDGLRVGGAGWPLNGRLLAGFGDALPDGRQSEGLLIAADAGTPVKAVGTGAVVYAAWMTGYGLLLIVDHGDGYMSLYAHNDALLHERGDAVQRGDPLATVGSSGGSGRPALYFELRKDGQPVDPTRWLER